MADLNLNSQLISKESPLIGTTVQSAYDFDTQTERGAISSMHIKDFSFSRGTGGTLTLAEGMSIINSSGTTVIDSTGLVSTTQFPYESYETGTATNWGTSTTYQAIPNGTLTVVCTRTTNVLFLFSGCVYVNNIQGTSYSLGNLGIDVDGTTALQVRVFNSVHDASIDAGGGNAGHIIMPLGAGTHTAYLKIRVENEGDRVTLAQRSFTAIMLGQ